VVTRERRAGVGVTAHSIALWVHTIPTLLWCVIAWECWRLRWRHPRTTLFLLLALVSSLFAVHMLLHLLDEALHGRGFEAPIDPTAVHLATATFVIASAPIMRHALRLLPFRPNRPSRGWLAANYGSGLVAFAIFALLALDGRSQGAGDAVAYGYVVVLFSVTLARTQRASTRRGAWLQGLGIAQLRAPEVALLGVGLLTASAMLLVSWYSGVTTFAASGGLLAHTIAMLLFAVPFAVRMLGRVVRGFLLSSLLLGGAAAVFFAGADLSAGLGSPVAAQAARLATFTALALLFVPGRAIAARAIDHVVFRRSRQRSAELQRAAAALSPSDGLEACCRTALACVTRILGFSGGAIVLTRRRGTFAHGTIDLDGLTALWPAERAAHELPARPLMEVDLRELPADLQVAIEAADVSRLASIASPRQHWGHLFATEPIFAAPIEEAEIEALGTFLSQLALVLDGCELLERAIEVERSLAHAEKLAAIGELSARVAHEIRNPVTAARSLAQLMARDPTSEHNTEHADLILGEL
jgi:signal transduction histidine kinase